ncbi:MAG: Ig-like domain-containing protein, partial [Bifidobacteriaceae bacterium]|jgi:hypothetical protein|nr:Ig-like domain-containing protein [Bifidobacteriaceae bacterium]
VPSTGAAAYGTYDVTSSQVGRAQVQIQSDAPGTCELRAGLVASGVESAVGDSPKTLVWLAPGTGPNPYIPIELDGFQMGVAGHIKRSDLFTDEEVGSITDTLGVDMYRDELTWHPTMADAEGNWLTNPGAASIARFRTAAEHGAKILLILDYGHPTLSEGMPHTDADRQAFAEYTRRVIEAVGAQNIGAIEVWNEWNGYAGYNGADQEPRPAFTAPCPNDPSEGAGCPVSYAKLVGTVEPVVRQYAPGVPLLAGASGSTLVFNSTTTQTAWNWAGLMLAQLRDDGVDIDGFSVHAYAKGATPQGEERTADRIVADINALKGRTLTSYGKELPIYVTETGWSTCVATDETPDGVCYSEEFAASALVEVYVGTRALGDVAGLWWYTLKDQPPSDPTVDRAGDEGANYGLYRQNGSIKQAGKAYSALNDFWGDCPSLSVAGAGEWERTSRNFTLACAEGAERRIVLAATETDLALAQAEGWTAVDLLGQLDDAAPTASLAGWAGRPVGLVKVAAGLDVAASSFAVSKAGVVADGEATGSVAVSLVGTDGEPYLGAVTLAGSGSSESGLTLGSFVDQGSGTYVASVTGTRVGDWPVEVTVNGLAVPVSDVGLDVAHLVPGPPAFEAGLTRLAGPDETASADGSSGLTVTATVVDAQGRAIAGVDVTFDVPAGVSVAGTDGPVSATVSTDATGVASIALTSVTPDTYQVTAIVGGNPIVEGSPAEVVFTPTSNPPGALGTPRVAGSTSSLVSGDVHDDDLAAASEGVLVAVVLHAETRAELGRCTVGTNGSFTCALPDLSHGTLIAVRIVGPASQESPDALVAVDALAPAGTKVKPSDGRALAGVGEEPGNQIRISAADGTQQCATTVGADLSWACTLTTPAASGDVVSVEESDRSGNVGTLRWRIGLPAVAVASGSIRVGETQSATGVNFQPGEQVGAVMRSDPVAVGVATADENGSVKLTWTIPDSVAAGDHRVTLTGELSGEYSAGFTVSAASPSGPSSVPPSSVPPSSAPPSSSAPSSSATQPPSGSPSDSAGGVPTEATSEAAPDDSTAEGTDGTMAATGANAATIALVWAAIVLMLIGGLAIAFANLRRRRS